MRSTSDKRVLITFCGTVDRRREVTTIGDLMAVYNILLSLRGFVRQVDVAWQGNLFDLRPHIVDVDAIDATSYDLVAYVCGPVTVGHRALFSKFPSSKKIAVGVSVTNKVDPYQFIDAIYLRDSDSTCNFDLALADIGYPHFTTDAKIRDDRVAVCLVGDQAEYGSDDGYDKAATLVEQATAARRTVTVQTLLDEGRAIPASVECDLQCATSMITTRMHGSLLAIFHGIPVISLDQIHNGAKVTRMVAQLDWPVFNAWTTSPDQMVRQLEEFRLHPPTRQLRHSRDLLLSRSRNALNNAVEFIMQELKEA